MTIKSVCKYLFTFFSIFFLGSNGYAFSKTQSGSITVTESITNVSCNGGSNGAIDLTVSGLNAPFTFLWSNNEITEDIINLSAGSYLCTVYDASGDSLNLSYNISEPSPIVITGSVNNVTCYGGNDGSVIVNAVGGSGGYGFLWNNASTTQSVSAISVGSYTVTVTDINNCSASSSFNVNEPSAITISAIVQTINCYGNTDGAINLTANGGSGTLSFLWSDGSTSEDLIGKSAGIYSLTITDANGCTKDTSIEIIQGAQIIITGVVTNVSCNGLSDGSIQASATGGNGSYSYTWDNSSVSQNINGLTANNYNLIVKDGLGCIAQQSFSVNEPSSISVSSTVVNASCYGQNNGSVSLLSNGGVGNYSYQWSNGSVDSLNQNLSAGNYSVTVTDANGCTFSNSYIVNQPNSIALSSVVSNVQCYGFSNGVIDLSVTGGVVPYTYLWSTSQTTQDINSLAVGSYTVTITDGNNCTSSLSFAVSQPAQINFSLSTLNPSCGLSNGSISTSVSGGVSPYSYLWSNSSTLSSISNLSAGSYAVTITDANGCTASQTTSLVNQSGPSITSGITTNVSCYGGNNGSINISISGGKNPISYNWSNNQTTQDLTGLASGTYTVTVTDANSCTASANYTISQPASISANITTTATTCGQNNGAAVVNASGGTGSYTYLWNNSSTLNTINNVAAGVYSVTITDVNSCTLVASSTVTAILPPIVTQNTLTNVLCNGDSTGAITIGVNNGTAPFTFVWSNGATTQNISTLKNGVYTVTVTDANGCTARKSFTITQPTFLSLANFSVTNATCGQANGAAQINPSGAVSPYSYLWSNGITSNIVSNISSGTYSVTVTDANGCSRRKNIVVANTNGPVLTLSSQTNVLCFGVANGAIDISVSGGTFPYTYNWSNGNISQDITGALAGVYSITVTDSNGCTASQQYTITQPNVIVPNATITNANCILNSGSISTNVTGGVSPYNYNWSNGGVSSSISNLSAGNYSLTITDNNGCTVSWNGAIVGAGSPSSTFVVNNVTCYGYSDGSIIPSVTGGNPPYSFLWSNGSTSQSLNNVAGGSYSVTITDQLGCTANYTQTIQSPLPLNITTNITNVNCYNGNTGSIQLTVTGGTSPYSYQWNNSATTNPITNLSYGTYNVTVTDNRGCTINRTYGVNQNTSIQRASWVVINNNCNGGSTGAINQSFVGGSGTYTYLWSNGETTEDLANLAAGTYTITVTDNLGCSNSFIYTVTEPAAIVATTTSTNTTCGLANGSASVSASGGTSPLSYLWSNGANTTTISNILAGVYTVTVTDINGCTLISNSTVSNQAGPIITSSVITDPLCYGGSNGSINISVSGGTVILNYAWSSGQSSQDISGVIAGNYIVTVTDANNCSTTGNYTVNQPSAITASFTSAPSTCNQTNGSIAVSPSGGTPGYTYLWNNGSTQSSISSIAAGNYTVTITDAHSCKLVQNSTVASQPSPVVVQNTLTSVLCNGDSTGAITITVNGGTLPLSFLWSNGQTTQNISNLSNGGYTVTVTDANGCTGRKSFFVSQPAFISLVNYSVVNSTCGQSNGSAQINPTGGISPYTYLWSNGSVINQIVNVSAGTYSVTVTDANGCTKRRNIIIQNTNGPVLTLSNQTNVSCYAGNNGALDILLNGGVTPYSYLWSNGAVSQDLSNIPAGDYTVTITDANGCIAGQQFTVTQPDPIQISSNVINANCGQSSGSINLTTIGGTAPYSYNWSSGGVASSINNLSAGLYTVSVTDARLCTATIAIAVVDNPGPSLVLDSIINSTCYNQPLGKILLTTINGSGPFTYLWNNGVVTEDNLNIVAGNYSVTVTDVHGCTTNNSYSISQTSQIVASFNVTNANCNLSNGSAIVTASGGVGSYTYVWSNGTNGSTISNQTFGNYSVVITDANNCSVVDSVNIFNSGQEVVSLVTQVNPTCNNGNNGQLTISISGGLGPYQLQWSNGSTAYTNSNLSAGNYILTVTDITGCPSQTSYTLTEPTPLNISFTSIDEHCNQIDGTITANVTGSNGAYTYLWSSGSSSSQISNLSSGNYTLTVTDNLGCVGLSSLAISNIASPIIAQSQITNANCFNSSTGIVDINVQGGVSPYNYQWSNSTTNEDLINVTAGVYIVTVTDVYGCTVRKSYSISQPDSIAIIPTIDNAGCGNNNGQINIAVSGGTSPYSYAWSNGGSHDTLTNLFAGIYSVIVSDFNNCNTQQFFAVGNINSAVISIDSLIDVKCYSQSNGSIYPSLSQGEPPYSYEWSTGATSLNLLNAPAGQYVLTITDNNGCVSILIDTITQPDSIQILSFVNNPKCNLSNGDISVIPSGGTLPFTYLWNTGQSSSTISGINSGIYTVTVTDNHGCTNTGVSSIINSGNPVIALNTIDSVSCNGLSDGSINVTINGGVSPYIYQWVGTGQNTEDLQNVPAGGYSLIVTDDLGCTSSQSFTVAQPTQIQVNLIAVQNASCGSNNGYAVVSANGGAGGFNYYWSNATNNDTLINVGAGSYTLTAIDGAGCSSSIIVNVSNINGPVIASVDSGNVTCPNVNDGYITISVTGGTLPYQYSWSTLPDTTASVTNLTGGNYTLTVKDALNCIAIRTVSIIKPQPIIVNGYAPSLNSPYNLSCYRSDDGSIILNVSGGTSPFDFVWSNGSITQNVSTLQAGTYTVYLTDHNGCTKDSTFFITQPPQLIAFAGTDFNVCGQTQTLLSATQPTYGLGSWSLSSGPPNINFSDSTSNITSISNLVFGDYQLLWIVSDGFCSDSDMVLMNVSSQIIAQAGSDKILCGRQIYLNATRPQFGYGYWSDSSAAIVADTSDPFSLVTNLNYGANLFNWVVVNGTCRDTGVVNVFVRDSIDCLDPVLLPNAFTPNNDGFNDYFEIKGIQDFPDNELTIFNRWGLVVYSAEHYLNSWDGIDNNGNMVSDGTYFAVLNLKSINKIYKTYIDLRR